MTLWTKNLLRLGLHDNRNPIRFGEDVFQTIGLSQSALSVQSLKETYEKIRDNHQAAFPHLPSRTPPTKSVA
jgi:hypothetical protein